jgi:hypothetical protein
MWISKYSNLASFVVGITFLFSGMVKLNDPRSFAYKIEEYLHIWASQITVHTRLLLPYTLGLAVCVATLESVLGAALLAHWQRFWTLTALLILTLFFALLTLYTATSKRVASCGCFGDALALTPWQSFTKSVLLLFLIGGLYWQETGSLNSLNSHYWIVATLLFSLGLSRHTLRHLPVFDFLPYKVGSDLSALIQLQAPLRYVYAVEKEGKIMEIEHYPREPGCKLISTRLLNPEYVSLSTYLSIWKGDKDYTRALLDGQKLLIIIQHPASITASALQKLSTLIQQLERTLQPVLLAPSGQGEEIATALALPLHAAHPLLLKDMLRAPLGLLLLKEGIVTNKWNFNDFAQARKTLKQLGWLQQ